tara:strand:+ start:960 stop:1166 length:207 start_codon:yes stop_codon:yes gene_type:complete
MNGGSSSIKQLARNSTLIIKFSIESMNTQELHGYMMSGIKNKDTKILASDIIFVELPDIFDELDMPTD